MKFLLTIASVVLYIFSYGQSENVKLVLPTSHNFLLEGVAASPDGKYFASSESGGIRIWEASTGRLVRIIEPIKQGEYFESPKFSPDSQYILSSDINYSFGTTTFWEIKTGKQIYSIPNSGRGIISPDGKQVALVEKTGSVIQFYSNNNGSLLRELKGDITDIYSIKFSNDGKQLLSISGAQVILWDLSTGAPVLTITNTLKLEGLRDAILSKDKTRIITGSEHHLQIWDAKNGNLLYTSPAEPKDNWFHLLAVLDNGNIVVQSGDVTRTLNEKGVVIKEANIPGGVSIASPTGDILIVGDETAAIIDKNGNVARQLNYFVHPTDSHIYMTGMPDNLGAFSPDGSKVVIGYSYDNVPKVCDVKTGKLLFTLGGPCKRLTDIVETPEASKVAAWFGDGYLKLLDINNGRFQTMAHAHSQLVMTASPIFLSKGEKLLGMSGDSTYTIWDIKSGESVMNFEIPVGFQSGMDIDPAEKILLAHDGNSKMRVYDIATGRLLTTIDHGGTKAIFTKDGKYMFATGQRNGAVLEVATRQPTMLFPNFTRGQFTPDDKGIIAGGEGGLVKGDIATREFVRYSSARSHYFLTLPNRLLNYDDKTGTVETYDYTTGKQLSSFSAKPGLYNPTAFDNNNVLRLGYSVKYFYRISDGLQLNNVTDDSFPKSEEELKYPIISRDGSVMTLTDHKDPAKTLTWTSFNEDEWIVLHPSGLFDASPGAMQQLYFVQGMDIIELDQLKSRYYEPGLWKKVMSGEKLRDVEKMKTVELAPSVVLNNVDEKGYLNIAVTNKGGGIGEVNIFVNGKEILKDVRPSQFNAKSSSANLRVYVGNNKNLLKGDNVIAARAWNADHWVVGKSQPLVYTVTGTDSYQPAIHILACGVSDYTGDEIDLKYAGKDAQDVANALQLGAKHLFGTGKSFVYSLTTLDPKDSWPSKINIEKAFSTIAANAHPKDVLVVYLSGHGINGAGPDGDWHYLTQEAYTASPAAYSDPAILAQTTISANELVELFKTVPALKQVLIIDACASGKVVENLMAQKDISSSTLRALDRMKDRMGMHIITGCTADAVSYEASRYAQGVLTYSLLEGIRGAALRDDQFVDISRLFQYAQDRVPELASGIGGIQTPMIFSPNGEQSFDIGQFGEAEKKEIPIAKVKPVYIRSSFQDSNELEDVLGLGKKLNDAFRDTAAKTSASFIYVDVNEYPEGCKLVGRYTSTNGKIDLKVRKRCEGADSTVDVSGNDVTEVVNKVLATVK